MSDMTLDEMRELANGYFFEGTKPKHLAAALLKAADKAEAAEARIRLLEQVMREHDAAVDQGHYCGKLQDDVAKLEAAPAPKGTEP